MLAATIEVLDEGGSGGEGFGGEGFGDGRRADARIAVDRPSTVRCVARTPHDVRVQDLSAQGFAFRTDRAFTVGSAIELGLSGAGTARARIVRRDGALFGCMFDQPLSPERLAQAFTGASVATGSFGAFAPAIVPDERWPRPVRAAMLLGSAGACWLGVIAGARALLG